MANQKSTSWYGGAVVVTRAAAALPQTATDVLFEVTGTVKLLNIEGLVTVDIGNVANATKLTHVATDICATLDIDDDVPGTRYSITGTFGNAMLGTASGVPVAVQATPVVLPEGDLILDCGGSDGGDGRVTCSVEYLPLSEGATMVAA